MLEYVCNRCGAIATVRGSGFPQGWSSCGCGEFYCPHCTARRADKREAAQKNRPSTPLEKKPILAYVIGIIIALVVFLITESSFYTVVSFCIGGTIPFFFLGYKKDGCGCMALSAVIIGVAIVFLL